MSCSSANHSNSTQSSDGSIHAVSMRTSQEYDDKINEVREKQKELQKLVDDAQKLRSLRGCLERADRPQIAAGKCAYFTNTITAGFNFKFSKMLLELLFTVKLKFVF